MVSNSDTPLIKKLYSGYNIIPIVANRSISSNPKTRKKAAREVIIITYNITGR